MAKQGALSALSNGGLSELWARLRFLFLAIIVYRIGAHIPVPGINPDQLAVLFKQNEGTILSLFNMFSGGALERMSIFALGIMPYISASIIMQLMTAVSPQLEALKKEGESGRTPVTALWCWQLFRQSVCPSAWQVKVSRSRLISASTSLR
jgi:preprotein translocase subunit SecY